MKQVRVLVVDPVPIVREGLKASLGRRDGVQIVGEAETVREALRMIDMVSCNVVLIDLHLPDGCGIECLRRLKEAHPETPILVFSNPPGEAAVLEAIQAGADGFVVKCASVQELQQAISSIHAGKQYLHPSVVGTVMRNIRTTTPDHASGPPTLPARQEQVLALAVRGLSNRLISDQLNISQSSVKAALRALFSKFEAYDRTQLILRVVKDDLWLKKLEAVATALLGPADR
ncbi:MAG: response regulator transcription factor [Candidatus Xenobia bacterium]